MYRIAEAMYRVTLAVHWGTLAMYRVAEAMYQGAIVLCRLDIKIIASSYPSVGSNNSDDPAQQSVVSKSNVLEKRRDRSGLPE